MYINILPMLPDFIALTCLYYYIWLPRWRRLSHSNFIWHTVLYIYICIILMLTLMPIITNLPNIFSGFSAEINFHPFIDWQLQRGSYLTESLLNISLFIPFGFLIQKTLRLKPLSAIMIGMIFSISIEVLQPLISTNRVGDISDVITNTVGTCIGILLYQLYKHKWF